MEILLPLRIRLHNPVFIYQMGKVASSSIYESLKEINDLNVFHIHRLCPDNIQKVKEGHLNKGIKPQEEYLGLYLYRKIFQPGRPAKIISLIREPVGRNISAYFQNLDLFEKRPNAHTDSEITELINNFLANYSHDVPLTWFDAELKCTTGIDVFEEDFPKESGYKFYHEKHYQLLILRHDLDDRFKARLLKDFLKLDELEIIRANIGTAKNYADTYNTFLNNIKLPEQYVERMLTSKYARHFFDEDELANIRRKWTN